MCPTDCIGNDQIPSAKAHGAKEGLSLYTLTYCIFSTQKKQILAWTITLNHRDMTVFIKEW